MKMTLKFLREHVNYIGNGLWSEDVLDEATHLRYKIKYIRYILQEEPWMCLEIKEITPMKENTAEVIDFEEAVQAKISGSGGGYDHFTGMTIGTRFASIANGAYTSECDEYILLARQGPTVLLQNISPREGFQDQERHIGSKFWKLNTLVQILHIPDASETGPPPLPVEGRTTNGNSLED